MRHLKIISVSFAALMCVSAPLAAQNKAPSPVQLVLEELNKTSATSAPANKGLNTPSQLKSSNASNIAAKALLKRDLKLEGQNTSTPEGIDLLQLNIGQDSSEYKTMRDKLTDAYGAPKSQRGGIEIWEIETANASFEQSRMTTIMTGQDSGGFFVTVDRRGNSGRTLPPPKPVLAAPRAVTAPQVLTPRRLKIDPSVRD
ncbi:hypothetical protein [Hellea balneolensis]|uniref:hypothetical protein n=1 Tax=Hellea balneolensis TaxID=287478 RepID=UPI00047A6EB0|nr:hypothetical protein [Hellea balneolensis]